MSQARGSQRLLARREGLTGIGLVSVRAPKIRDRSGARIKFTSALLPLYLRRP